MMVTGASARPSAISGSVPTFITSAIDGFCSTSRRPMEVVGPSENGLKAGVSGVVSPGAASAAASTVWLPDSVGTSPVHPPANPAIRARKSTR
jgi:hypothetical protein